MHSKIEPRKKTLLDQFNLFLEEACKWPSSFWAHKFYATRKSFVLQLDEMKFAFKEKDTKAYTDIESFISVLNQELDELRLAKAMYALSLIFFQSGKKNEKILLFKTLADRFLQRAELFSYYRASRAKFSFDATQKKSYDEKLFANEGTFYCLEYYLSVYKKLTELKDATEKKKFLEAEEINLGFGNLPGLKADFTNDEILKKFILLILEDMTRERLLISYYACKNILTDETSADAFEKVFKKFIYYLLLSFDENHVEKLSSAFLKPYGDQPTIKSLIPLFASYDQ